MTELFTFFSTYASAFHALLDLLTTAIVAVGIVRSSSIINVIVSGAKTKALMDAKDTRIRELTLDRNNLKESLDAAIAGHEGWRASIEQVSRELADLKQEVEDLRHRLSIATRYILDLLVYIRHTSLPESFPPIPLEIQEDLDSIDAKKIIRDSLAKGTT